MLTATSECLFGPVHSQASFAVPGCLAWVWPAAQAGQATVPHGLMGFRKLKEGGRLAARLLDRASRAASAAKAASAASAPAKARLTRGRGGPKGRSGGGGGSAKGGGGHGCWEAFFTSLLMVV